MTRTERLYRARVRDIVQEKIERGARMSHLARTCFHDKSPPTRASSKNARRALEREMGKDPARVTSKGVTWETLESLATGLGCSVMYLFSWSKFSAAGARVTPDGSIVFRSEADLIAWAEDYQTSDLDD